MKLMSHTAILMVFLAACRVTDDGAASTRSSSMRNDLTEKNKQTVRRVFDDFINRSMRDILPELVAADFAGAGGQKGPEAFGGPIQALLSAVPDVHFTVADLFAEGDRVAVRWTWSGTHTGPFRGFAPSNKHVDDTGIAIYQLRDGKIVGAWIQTDRLGFLQQIGAIPPIPGVSPPPAPSNR